MEPSHFCFFLTLVCFVTVFYFYLSEMITLGLVTTLTIPLARLDSSGPQADTARGFHESS
jgi:hypothetical protein